MWEINRPWYLYNCFELITNIWALLKYYVILHFWMNFIFLRHLIFYQSTATNLHTRNHYPTLSNHLLTVLFINSSSRGHFLVAISFLLKNYINIYHSYQQNRLIYEQWMKCGVDAVIIEDSVATHLACNAIPRINFFEATKF